MAQKPVAAKAKPATPEALAARAVGKLLWDRDFYKTNPDADAAKKREAWTAARAAYVKAGRQLLGRLKRAGYTVQPLSATPKG